MEDDDLDMRGRSDDEDEYLRGFRGRGHYSASRSRFDERARHNHEDGDVLEDTGRILGRLAAIDTPYIFVPRVRSSSISMQSLHKHFDSFLPAWIAADESGWYVAFNSKDAANRCRMVMDKTTLSGFHINIEVRMPSSDALAERKRSKVEDDYDNASRQVSAPPAKTEWTEEELIEDAALLLQRDMGNVFVRDVKARILQSYIADLLNPKSAGGKILHAPKGQLFLDDRGERPKASRKQIKREETPSHDDGHRHRQPPSRATQKPIFTDSEDESDDAHPLEPVEASQVLEDEEAAKTSKKLAKAVKQKKPKKELAGLNDEDVEMAGVTDEKKEAKPLKKKGTAKKISKPITERSPSPDPFELGIAETDEDLHFLRLALERMHAGKTVQAAGMPEQDLAEEQGGPHASGSARTEGFYRIPPSEKAAHLPDRNRAIVDPQAAIGLASARDNRADSRRFVQGIEQHKKDTATDTDILKFNQLRTRKKQLKFAKSPIHDWGLYAMELIPAGDMVIEYVGEVIRQQVADEREKMYERQGNFSTYLFRVDDDLVVDATRKGNIARLMNVSESVSRLPLIQLTLFAFKALLHAQL